MEQSIVFRGIGLDAFWNVLKDYGLRCIRYDDRDFYSLVDLVRLFGEDNRKSKKRQQEFNPRRYWSDHKRELLDGDAELYDSIVRMIMHGREVNIRDSDNI